MCLSLPLLVLSSRRLSAPLVRRALQYFPLRGCPRKIELANWCKQELLDRRMIALLKRCRGRLCLALAVERRLDHRLSDSGSSLLYCLLSLAYHSTASGEAANLSARSSTNAPCSRCCSAQFGGELGSSSSRGRSSSRSSSSSRSRRSNSSSPDRSSSARRIQVELA